MGQTYEEKLIFQLLKLPRNLYFRFRTSNNAHAARALAYWIVGAGKLIAASRPSVPLDEQLRFNRLVLDAIIYLQTSPKQPKRVPYAP